MTRVATLCALLSLVLACGGDDDGGTPDGSGVDGSGVDGGGVDGGGIDGGGVDGGGVDGSGVDGGGVDGGGVDGGGVDGGGVDAGPTECVPATCDGRQYACGNCMDDDEDGFIDSLDPDCLGACDDNEEGYDLGIPGGEVGRCDRDCYYDTNQGSGDDKCEWDAQCDPLAPGPFCDFVPEDERTGAIMCPEPQVEACRTNCADITPNGCDCFGCCELPARSGNFVFLGSTDAAGEPSCNPSTVEDPDLCHPCTQVTGFCTNTCGRCELCLGETIDDLPDDCFPPPPVDAGPGIDGGPGSDGGTDAGTDAGMPDPRCPDGRQPCGAPSDPTCPADHFCLTGCCTLFM